MTTPLASVTPPPNGTRDDVTSGPNSDSVEAAVSPFPRLGHQPTRLPAEQDATTTRYTEIHSVIVNGVRVESNEYGNTVYVLDTTDRGPFALNGKFNRMMVEKLPASVRTAEVGETVRAEFKICWRFKAVAGRKDAREIVDVFGTDMDIRQARAIALSGVVSDMGIISGHLKAMRDWVERRVSDDMTVEQYAQLAHTWAVTTLDKFPLHKYDAHEWTKAIRGKLAAICHEYGMTNTNLIDAELLNPFMKYLADSEHMGDTDYATETFAREFDERKKDLTVTLPANVETIQDITAGRTPDETPAAKPLEHWSKSKGYVKAFWDRVEVIGKHLASKDIQTLAFETLNVESLEQIPVGKDAIDALEKAWAKPVDKKIDEKAPSSIETKPAAVVEPETPLSPVSVPQSGATMPKVSDVVQPTNVIAATFTHPDSVEVTPAPNGVVAWGGIRFSVRLRGGGTMAAAKTLMDEFVAMKELIDPSCLVETSVRASKFEYGTWLIKIEEDEKVAYKIGFNLGKDGAGMEANQPILISTPQAREMLEAALTGKGVDPETLKLGKKYTNIKINPYWNLGREMKGSTPEAPKHYKDYVRFDITVENGELRKTGS